MSGGSNLIVEARSALLDALDALGSHRSSVVLIGSQAVYLHTGRINLPLAEFTRDSDIALDKRTLSEYPLLEELMSGAGFYRDLEGNPGRWYNKLGIPVDFMVPEAIAGRGSRSADIAPHDKMMARRAPGIEGALVDHSLKEIRAIDITDIRSYVIKVAGPAALIVAKVFKIDDRISQPSRLEDKDAHDVHRIFQAISTLDLAESMQQLSVDPFAGQVTRRGLELLESLFAQGPKAQGSLMAGRAESGVGDPEFVSQAVAYLAQDLLTAVKALKDATSTAPSA